jgi:very-short-patch-repair endonuclease
VATFVNVDVETRHTPLDLSIAALASGQYGVVSLAQLVQLGVSASGVRERVRRGGLHRLYRGVYAVGHCVVPRHGRWLAAVLACGPGAVLSHRDAAALLGLRPSDRRLIDVTTPRAGGRAIDGIDAHRSRLTSADRTTVDGIPCTSVARTLLDLASTDAPQAQVDKAVDRAVTLNSFDLTAVNDVLARSNGRRGAPRLRRAVRNYEPTAAREGIEQRLLRWIKAADLPLPHVNQWIGDKEVDFIWPEHGVVVETDGYADHGGPNARRNDNQRDRELQLDGWRVIRFTWDDGRETVVRTLKAFLTSAGSSGRRRPRVASGARPWR